MRKVLIIPAEPLLSPLLLPPESSFRPPRLPRRPPLPRGKASENVTIGILSLPWTLCYAISPLWSLMNKARMRATPLLY